MDEPGTTHDVNENNDQRGGLTYLDAGVDIDAGNRFVDRIKPAVASTLRPEVLTGLGGFGGLFALDTERYRNPVLVSGTDGVGTKLILARDLGRHDSIGIDLVAMCVNDILTNGAEPLFFLDYFATGKLRPEQAQSVVEGIAEGCRQAGCALIGGETAEMPGMYGEDEYDLAGFTVGVVERTEIIDGRSIRSGHTILGLDSSGPHSNGYSLIRKVLALSGSDPSDSLGETTLGAALLAPTRIYVKPLLNLIERFRIGGIAHITGGGLTENITRLLPPELGIEINLAAWTRPEIFDWLQDSGDIRETEMLRTFNCGIGMALLVNADQADGILRAIEKTGTACHEIGRVVPRDKNGRVRYLPA
jgi:phosphoribosylformylglycinamidine cyclo-ligase